MKSSATYAFNARNDGHPSLHHLLIEAQLVLKRAEALHNVAGLTCALCGERIDLFWDSDSAEWMMKDVQEAEGGKYVHTECAA